MRLLLEINLVNIGKDGIDHFKQRRKERLVHANILTNKLIKQASTDSNIPISDLKLEISKAVEEEVNKNISQAAAINVQYAVIPVGILHLTYKGEKSKITFSSPQGVGYVFYIPVTNNIASTLMIVDNEIVGEWKRQHSSKREIPISEIEYIPFKSSTIYINLENIIEEYLISKKEQHKVATFSINDLPYEVDSDYRPKRDGKQNMFKLKTFDKRSFPIISTSGNEFQKDIKVKADNSNAANTYASKLTGRGNGLKPWVVQAEGTNLIFKGCYTTLGFSKEGEFKGLKEAKILNYLRLLKELTNSDIYLLD